MKRGHQVLLGAACCGVLIALAFALGSMRYAAGKLDSLRSTRGHATAESAMQDLMIRTEGPGRVDIVAAGNDGPGLRYVVARVWPTNAPATAAGHSREIGAYFLRMNHGWVHLPEDEVNGQVLAIGKALLDRVPGTAR